MPAPSSSSSPLPFPSSASTTMATPQASPLPTKRGEIGYAGSLPRSGSGSSRERLASSSSNSSAGRASSMGLDQEARLDSRLSGESNATGASSSSGSSSSSTTTSSSTIRTLRVPFHSASLRSEPRIPTSAPSQPKPPPSRLRRIIVPLILWVLTMLTIAGTGVGFDFALKDNARSERMAQEYEQLMNSTSTNSTLTSNNSTNYSNSTSSDDDDDDSPSNASLFLNTLFVLAFICLLTFLYRATRKLYIAIFYSYAPPSTPSEIENSSKLKLGRVKKWVQWFLSIPEERLHPKEETLPSYLSALGVPAAGRDVMMSLTREERRLRRIGSTRGTGDVEDVEVERSWRMGGGMPLPMYGGGEFRTSTVLLSGPPPPITDEAEGGLVRRLSRRVTDAVEVVRRWSGIVIGTSESGANENQVEMTENTDSSSSSSSSSRSSKLRPLSLVSSNPHLLKEKLNSLAPPSSSSPLPSPTTPVRLAYHASVILDVEAIEEEKKGEKEDSSESSENRVERRGSKMVGTSGTGGYNRRSWWQLGLGGEGTRRESIVASSSSSASTSTSSPPRSQAQAQPSDEDSQIIEIPPSLCSHSTSSSPRTPGNGRFSSQHRKRTSMMGLGDKLESVKEERSDEN